MNLKDLAVPRSELPKFAPAFQAAKQISNNMKVGLGTGTTAYWFVVLLGQRIQSEGLKVQCVPTSIQTAELAQFHKVPLTTLNDVSGLDVVVDGADEISPQLELMKGGGGALLHEKIVANASGRMIVIADETKFVNCLGKFPLPVEVVKFGWRTTREKIRELLHESNIRDAQCQIRAAGMNPVLTDEGHYIIDCYCDRIANPAILTQELNDIPGVVENGLFINFADEVILGNTEGKTRTISLSRGDLGLNDIELPIDLEIIGED